MIIVLVAVHVLICFTLILVILLQAGRGQGLTGPTFGSGNVQSLFGTRAGDFLTKATSVAAIGFLLTCIGLNIMEARKSRSLLEGSRQGPPIDMEAVKRALEQAKAGQTADGKGQPMTEEQVKAALQAAMEEAAKSAPQAPAADMDKPADAAAPNAVNAAAETAEKK